MLKYFYLLILVLLITLVTFIQFRATALAEHISMFVWTMLFFLSTYYIVSHVMVNINQRNLPKGFSLLYQFIMRNHKSLLMFFLSGYILISSLSTTYFLGGDDTRLYYLYPSEYFSNYASKIGGSLSISNVSTFLPPTSIAAFVLLLASVKAMLPFVNLQGLFYSLNIVLGVYFFYKFQMVLFNEDKKKMLLAISSCMYVFSIFNFYTLFNSQLMAIYLISIFPMFLYLFYRSVFEKKLQYLLYIAIVFSVFGVVSVSSIWFFASLLALSPLILYMFWPKMSRAIGYGFLLMILLFAINIFWIRYLPETTIANTDVNAVNSISSEEFIKLNSEGVRSTAEINSLFYPLLNSYHRQIQLNFNWPYLPIYQSWYFSLLPLSLFFISIIFLAGFFIERKTQYRNVYIFSGFSFILAIYLFTVHIGVFKFGNPGIDLYVWLVDTLPGFVAFRNMYDKFGHAMSFVYPIIFVSASLILVQKFKSQKVYTTLVALLSLLVILQAKPFLGNEFNALPVWTTSHVYQGITDLNTDYLDMARYMKSEEEGERYLVLPLSSGNVIAIQDVSLSNHYYIGVSPLLIVSGKNDLSGFLSFGEYGNLVKDALIQGDYETIYQICKSLKVTHVILNKEIPTELSQGYMYPDGIFSLQDEEFMSYFLGEKERDFGSRYSVYKFKN